MRTHANDAEGLYERAAGDIIEALARRLHAKGTCVIGIVGGRTVEGLFAAFEHHLHGRALAGEIHIFWLDERIHWEKNFLQALPFLERLRGALSLTWHPIMAATREAAEAEVEDIGSQLTALGGFDLVVASAGEDGHIASLFPDHPALGVAQKRYVIVDDAPKPPPLRASVSAPLLLTAGQGFLFFVGKREAYERFEDPSVAEVSCPAKLLKRLPELDVYVSR